jgi:hypothetical protein
MKRIRALGIVPVVVGFGAFAAPAIAGSTVPHLLTQQGRLFDTAGNPESGTMSIHFALYAAATGGASIWSETQSVTLDSGYFSTQLGESTTLPTSAFDGSELFVGVTVGTDAEMTPREPVVSVPYALVAENAIGDIAPHSVSVAGAPVIDSSGHWVGSTSGLTGPQGASGPQGGSGAQGAAGAQGAQGATGAQGSSGPQGATGAQGAQGGAGPQGSSGPQGATGAQGAQGTASISATASFAGAVGGSVTTTAAWAFIGPTAQVTTTAATPRLTAAAMVSLGASTQNNFNFGLCYQPSGGGALTTFATGINYSTSTAQPTRTSYPASLSVVPAAAGIYNVGFCVNSSGTATTLNNNDWVNGWVQVTN